MRIAEIAPGILPVPPQGFGAIERVVWELSNALKRRGHEVEIFNLPSLPADLSFSKFDAVHCHWAAHALVLARRGIRYAYTSHSHLWKQTCLYAIQASSHYLALHKGMIPDSKRNDSTVVGNGINPQFWRDLGMPRKNQIVACAHYHKRKRLERMFDLIDLLPREWKGIIVGPGCRDHLRLDHPRVTIMDEVPADELLTIFNQAKFGFHPADEEALALVPLQMSACGLITLVNASSHEYESIFPVVPYYDIEHAARFMIGDTSSLPPAIISQMAHERFSWDSVAERVEAGLERMMRNGNISHW